MLTWSRAAAGTVVPVGGDWALTDANNVNGSLTVNVRQTFKTDDGAYIQVFETGQSQPDGKAFVRLAFETGSEKYYWVNSVVAVGIIHGAGTNEISIDAWEVSTLPYLHISTTRAPLWAPKSSACPWL